MMAKSVTILDVHELNLTIYLKFLQSTFFKKKYEAIKCLNSSLEQVANQEERSRKSRFLIENNILDIIYIKSYHQEIAQRSKQILRFLSSQLNGEILTKILTSAFDSNSLEKASTICEVMESITDHLDQNVTLLCL